MDVLKQILHISYLGVSKDELISDVLLWTPTHGCARVGRPAQTYIQQLCEDTGCNPEDLPEAMNDREKWRETVRDIRAGGATWWWWWCFLVVLNALLSRRICLMVQQGVGHVKHCGCCSCHSKKECVSLVWPICNLVIVTCSLLDFLKACCHSPKMGLIWNRLIGLVGGVFANAPGDLDSISGQVIRKTLKMVLDTSLLNTQHYKVHIKSKVEQFREESSILSYTSV